LRAHTTVLLSMLLACSSSDGALSNGSWSGTTVQHGDTTVVTTAVDSRHPRLVLDSVTILWRSDSLDRPTQVLLVGDSLLAVADRERIFVVGIDGRVRSTLSRRGSGPGEFEDLGLIAVDGTRIVAIDRSSPRWASFALDGELVASGTLAAAPNRLINLDGNRMVVRDSSLLLGWLSLGDGENEPMRGGIASHPLNGTAATVLQRIDGQVMNAGSGGVLMVRNLFGPYPRMAVAPDGRVAVGGGVRYCVSVSGDAAPMEICRDWSPIPVTDGVRNPDYADLVAASGRDAETFAPFREVLDRAEIGEVRNSFTGLRFDTGGDLWVQVVDSLVAHVHPILGRFVPERLPRWRHYDVFDRDGTLKQELLLPSSFTPWDAQGDRIYGLYETPEGDLAVAMLRLP
jgi:hypothetical protein